MRMETLTGSSCRQQSYFFALACLLSCLVNGHVTANETTTTWQPCSLHCNCSLFDEELLLAKCDLTPTSNCESVVLPDNFLILDLSRNGVFEVPFCVLKRSTSIVSLSLSGNSINVIEEKSFPVLPYLLHLNLSYNGLRQWKGDISTVLPSLESVDLTGNELFIPSSNLFGLNSLLEVSGIVWSTECGECDLIRSQLLKSLNDSDSQCITDVEIYRYAEEIHYGKSLFFVKEGFSPLCLCEREDCETTEINIPYNVEVNTLLRKLFYAQYILGIIAFVLNLVVVLVSFGSRSLRKSTSFILIGNIGVCDVMMGVYSVLIGRFNVSEFITNESEYPGVDVFENLYCTLAGAIFTTAQMTSVLSSFLATLERYLSIVYCMNPEARLRKRTALWCLAGIWCAAIGYSFLAVFKVGGLRYHGEFTCMMPFLNGPEVLDTSIIGLTVASLLVLFYLVSFVLYLYMFHYVKKTELSAGIKRKASLAKNISLMVFTNFVFFVIPLTCTLLFVYRYHELAHMFGVDDSLRKLQIYLTLFSWLPVVLLSCNSCINPLLCAYRHPKFRRELHAHVNRCRLICHHQSRDQFILAWTLTAAQSMDLKSTDSIVTNENINERYISLEVL